MRIGSGDHVFEWIDNWPRMPESPSAHVGWAHPGMATTVGSIRGQIASAITVVVQLQRLPDGKRKLTSVSEIEGMDGETINVQEIFRFVKERTDSAGDIHGRFQATGIRPHFLDELRAYGIDLPASHFDPSCAL